MQKWFPEAFATDRTEEQASSPQDGVFEPDATSADLQENSVSSRFRSESRFTDSQALLGHLTKKERAQLFDLVEKDVASEFLEREEELRSQTQVQIQTLGEAHQALLKSLAAELDTAMAGHLKEIAAASARLAIQLAEKIVRQQVNLNQEPLVKTLETAQYKLLECATLHVNLNPEDAVWLQSQPDLLEELKINQVNADRRIERGGCVIKSGHQEWDATIARQVESLAEIVEDAITAAGIPSSILPPEENLESPLG